MQVTVAPFGVSERISSPKSSPMSRPARVTLVFTAELVTLVVRLLPASCQLPRTGPDTCASPPVTSSTTFSNWYLKEWSAAKTSSRVPVPELISPSDCFLTPRWPNSRASGADHEPIMQAGRSGDPLSDGVSAVATAATGVGVGVVVSIGDEVSVGVAEGTEGAAVPADDELLQAVPNGSTERTTAAANRRRRIQPWSHQP